MADKSALKLTHSPRCIFSTILVGIAAAIPESVGVVVAALDLKGSLDNWLLLTLSPLLNEGAGNGGTDGTENLRD